MAYLSGQFQLRDRIGFRRIPDDSDFGQFRAKLAGKLKTSKHRWHGAVTSKVRRVIELIGAAYSHSSDGRISDDAKNMASFARTVRIGNGLQGSCAGSQQEIEVLVHDLLGDGARRSQVPLGIVTLHG